MSTDSQSTITIQLPKSLKAKLRHAASVSGISVTQFINRALEFAANNAIDCSEARQLSERDSLAFIAMLNNPQPPNAALLKAARRCDEIVSNSRV